MLCPDVSRWQGLWHPARFRNPEGAGQPARITGRAGHAEPGRAEPVVLVTPGHGAASQDAWAVPTILAS